MAEKIVIENWIFFNMHYKLFENQNNYRIS